MGSDNLKIIQRYSLIIWCMSMLAACSMQGYPSASTENTQGGTGNSAVPASTTHNPTGTPAETYTHTLALTPTITLTPTPAPGLEFFNAAFDGSTIVGEIRNNTGQTIVMISSDDIPEFRFLFEFYRNTSYTQSNGKQVIRADHWFWGPIKVYAESGTFEYMNCILYPGETGAIFFPAFGSKDSEGYYENSEIINTIPAQLGLLYTYDSQYLSDPNLENKYHPQAENVTFYVENDRLYFEFDVDIPFAEAVDMRKQRIAIPAFINLYNKHGQLVDIVNNYLEILGYLELGKRNHITGFTHLTGDPTFEDRKDEDRLWINQINMEDTGPDSVSKIEVLVEFQWDSEARASPCWPGYPKR
jgi:hypothetical protein